MKVRFVNASGLVAGPTGPAGPVSTTPGPTGPQGFAGPQGSQGAQGVNGAQGPAGRPGFPSFYVCDGNAAGAPIQLSSRSGQLIDGMWSSGLRLNDVPNWVNSVSVRLWVKMGVGSGTIILYHNNDGSSSGLVAAGTVFAAAGSSDDAFVWSSATWSLSRGSFSSLGFKHFGVASSTYTSGARIAKARVEVWW